MSSYVINQWLYGIIYVALISLLLYHQRKRRQFSHVSFLLLLYILTGLSYLVGLALDIIAPILPISYMALLYLILSMYVVFTAFIKFNDSNFRALVIENKHIYILFSKLLIIGGNFALFFYTPFALKAILGGAIQAQREEGAYLELLRSYGLINSIAGGFASFFIIMLLTSVISFSIGKKLDGILLFTGSLSFIVLSFSFGGRDGIVYWGISVIFLYLLMKDFLPDDLKKKILVVSSLFLLLFSVPFLTITIQRFSVYSNPIFHSTIKYSGMPIANFNDRFILNPPLRYGGSNFSDIVKILNFIGFKIPAIYDRTELYWFYEQKGLVSWVFSTFLGGLLSDFGKIGTVLFVVLISARIRSLINQVNRIHAFRFGTLLEYILFYQFISWGVFYNKLYSGDYYMLALIFVRFIFWMSYKLDNKFKIQKQGFLNLR